MSLPPTPRADEFIALLEERLPERTVRHSISVAELMATTAAEAGVDRTAAVYAGLLHDLFKAAKGHVLLEAAQRYKLTLTDLQRDKPMLLHGPIAAEEARHQLGIGDDGVYDAIYWHTTGRPQLGRVGLLLYFADFAEPLRSLPEAEQARALLRAEGFEKALRFVATKKVEYIRTKHRVDPHTETFYAWLCEEPA